MRLTELEKLYRLLAGQKRLEILKLLNQEKEMSVGDIAAHIHLSFKSTSKHLLLLRQGGLLERRQSRFVALYRLSAELPPHIAQQLKLINRSNR
ncbi:MAG: metalloregulator ArsR/SmtB family transcription factor [Candidatus Veblenbacteria bacterium]|nr:metalloregulator ArsR/SmtB family transcription factor [Candidatus Veblenbacteria bacterium]